MQSVYRVMSVYLYWYGIVSAFQDPSSLQYLSTQCEFHSLPFQQTQCPEHDTSGTLKQIFNNFHALLQTTVSLKYLKGFFSV